MNTTSIPKGKLVIIGGHEDKGLEGESITVGKLKNSRPNAEILSSLISKVPRAHHIIEIIATASAIPEQMEEMYKEAYKNAGFSDVGFIRIETNDDACNPSFLKRIDYCHAVFFTGGDQTRLTSTLNNTPVLKTIKKKYLEDEHFIVAGTSAGAMSIPEVIITGGVIMEAMVKDDISIGQGFDIMNSILVDTHFIKRGRFARLAHAVALYPSLLGIGLGEDTALTISNGNEALCSGSGMVIIIDGADISNTNITTVEDNDPIVMGNLKVHILAEGSKFLLKERTFQI